MRNFLLAASAPHRPGGPGPIATCTDGVCTDGVCTDVYRRGGGRRWGKASGGSDMGPLLGSPRVVTHENKKEWLEGVLRNLSACSLLKIIRLAKIRRKRNMVISSNSDDQKH